MKPINILITMDVEPVKQESRWTGPTDEACSQRVIDAYWRRSIARGYPVSFFIHPEIASPHQSLFTRFDHDGGCLGLHVHATKFQYPTYAYEFGFYSADQQRRILTDAAERWAQAFDHRPLYFRPGAFSANDATFRTLVDLGFRGGSVSIPERVWPGRYCVWAGAVAHPHRPHREFRLVRGDLPFANIPLSVDRSLSHHSPGLSYCMDLRPEIRQRPVRTILDNIVREVARQQPRTPTLHLVTHNDQPYDDDSHPSTQRLVQTLDAIKPVCEQHGMTPVPATVASVSDQVLSQPVEPPEQWTQPNNPTDVG